MKSLLCDASVYLLWKNNNNCKVHEWLPAIILNDKKLDEVQRILLENIAVN